MACRVVNQSIFLLLLGAHQKHITLPIAHQAHYPANKNLWLSLSALELTKQHKKSKSPKVGKNTSQSTDDYSLEVSACVCEDSVVVLLLWMLFFA